MSVRKGRGGYGSAVVRSRRKRKPLRDDMSLRRSSRRPWHATHDYVLAHQQTTECLQQTTEKPDSSTVEVEGGELCHTKCTKGCNLERRLRRGQLPHTAAPKHYSSKSRAQFIYKSAQASLLESSSLFFYFFFLDNRNERVQKRKVSGEHTQVGKAVKVSPLALDVTQTNAAASGKNSYLVATYKGLLC